MKILSEMLKLQSQPSQKRTARLSRSMKSPASLPPPVAQPISSPGQAVGRRLLNPVTTIPPRQSPVFCALSKNLFPRLGVYSPKTRMARHRKIDLYSPQRLHSQQQLASTRMFTNLHTPVVRVAGLGTSGPHLIGMVAPNKVLPGR